MRVVLVRPELSQVPDILAHFSGNKNSCVQPWKLQKKSVIDPKVGEFWPGDNLSIGYLCSYLNANGHKAFMIDAFLLGWDEHRLATETLKLSPDVIGVSMLEADVDVALNLINKIRALGFRRHIVLGGYYPTFSYRPLLMHCPEVDSVVVGEGEQTLLELCDALENGSSLLSIPGLATRYREEVPIPATRNVRLELDTLPQPARCDSELIAARGYVRSIASSRGCAWAQCRFCCIHPFAKSSNNEYWRARSIKNVVDEIEALSAGTKPFRFNFVDEDFLPSLSEMARSQQFSREVRERSLDIRFLMSSRVPSLNTEVIQELKSAGLSTIFVGIESGVDRMLRYYCKGFDSLDAIRAVSRMVDLGITVFAGTILFDPFSSFDEVVQNYRYFKDIETMIGYFDLFRYSRRLQIYRGSPLYEFMRDTGGLVESLRYVRYEFKEEKVNRLYRTITKFQEAIYPCYESLGNTWANRNDDNSLKNREKEFGVVFHECIERFISIISKRHDGLERVIDNSLPTFTEICHLK